MRRAELALAALGAAACALAACQTVELGAPPADINACRPSQVFFTDEIWPNVLDKDYGGKRCSDASCHDAGSGRPLTLVPTAGVAAAIPLTGPWAANYLSASAQMNCSNAAASDLLLLPTNTRTHGGQMLFSLTSSEAQAIVMWPSVQP